MGSRARDKFFGAINAYKMLAPGDRVLACVSGGADSMCLLSLLLEAESVFGVTVEAAHVNHGIRGAEADRDEAFVREFCAERGVPLRVLRADVPAEARKTGESLELCARKLRYAYFSSLGCDKIATAHTGSDNAETFLMRLTRGTSLHGLCSIPPVRGNIIRPLISCFRQETEAYCKENCLSYMTDSTNASEAYTRNRFRLRVLPALREDNPAAEANVLRCIESLRRDDDCLAALADAHYARCFDEASRSLRTSELRKLHPALCYRVLAAFLSRNSDTDFEERHLSLLCEHLADAHYALVLPFGRRAEIENGSLFFREAAPKHPQPLPPVPVDRDFSGTAAFGGVRFRFVIRVINAPHDIGDVVLDRDKLGERIVLRGRLPGDRILLPNRGCEKSLKKLFSEAGVPPEARGSVPVLADEFGVIWVKGFGPDERRLPGRNTKVRFIFETEDQPQ